jgi:hypothetical protein
VAEEYKYLLVGRVDRRHKSPGTELTQFGKFLGSLINIARVDEGTR